MSDVLSALACPLGIALGLLGVWAMNRGHRTWADDLACACEHSLAWHDPATTQCHATIRHGRGLFVRVQTSRCGCRQYVKAGS
jgi:hypothetical protein